MGTGSKVLSVILRLGELCSAVVVTALLGRFFYVLNASPDGNANSRLIYAEVISCLQILFSLVLIFPYKYFFFAWPLDLICFILSMVAFGLLADLNSSCTSYWYWNYWGYYWGRFWTVAPRYSITFDVVNSAGCGSWRCILAFIFMGGMAWMLSAILGIFVSSEMRAGRESQRLKSIKEKVTRKKYQAADPEIQQ